MSRSRGGRKPIVFASDPFIASVVSALVLVTVAAGWMLSWWLKGPLQRVADYRWGIQYDAAPAADGLYVFPSPGGGDAVSPRFHLATRGAGVHSIDPRTRFIRHVSRTSTRGGLLSDDVSQVIQDATAPGPPRPGPPRPGPVYFLCHDEDQTGLCRAGPAGGGSAGGGSAGGGRGLADWESLIGLGSFPGLKEDPRPQISAVLPVGEELWFATRGLGIGIYSPHQRCWLRVLTADERTLLHDDVRDLLRDETTTGGTTTGGTTTGGPGRVWIATAGGINAVELAPASGTGGIEESLAQARWERFTTPDLISDAVRQLALSPDDGRMWYVTDAGGLGLRQGETWKVIRSESAWEAIAGLDSSEDVERSIAGLTDAPDLPVTWWLTTEGALGRYDRTTGTWASIPGPEGLSGPLALAAGDTSGPLAGIWVGAENGLYRYREAAESEFAVGEQGETGRRGDPETDESPAPSAAGWERTFAERPVTQIHVQGKRAAVTVRDADASEVYVSRDAEGWTRRLGAGSLIRPPAAAPRGREESAGAMRSREILSAVSDPQRDRIWVSTGDGIAAYDVREHAWSGHRSSRELGLEGNPAIIDLSASGDGREGALVLLSEIGDVRRWRLDEAGPADFVLGEGSFPGDLSDITAVTRDWSGHLWIGTGSRGVHRYDPDFRRWERVQLDNLVQVQQLAVSAGRVWIRLENGRLASATDVDDAAFLQRSPLRGSSGASAPVPRPERSGSSEPTARGGVVQIFAESGTPGAVLLDEAGRVQQIDDDARETTTVVGEPAADFDPDDVRGIGVTGEVVLFAGPKTWAYDSRQRSFSEVRNGSDVEQLVQAGETFWARNRSGQVLRYDGGGFGLLGDGNLRVRRISGGNSNLFLLAENGSLHMVAADAQDAKMIIPPTGGPSAAGLAGSLFAAIGHDLYLTATDQARLWHFSWLEQRWQPVQSGNADVTGVSQLVADDDAVYALLESSNELLRIDPSTGRIGVSLPMIVHVACSSDGTTAVDATGHVHLRTGPDWQRWQEKMHSELAPPDGEENAIVDAADVSDGLLIATGQGTALLSETLAEWQPMTGPAIEQFFPAPRGIQCWGRTPEGELRFLESRNQARQWAPVTDENAQPLSVRFATVDADPEQPAVRLWTVNNHGALHQVESTQPTRIWQPSLPDGKPDDLVDIVPLEEEFLLIFNNGTGSSLNMTSREWSTVTLPTLETPLFCRLWETEDGPRIVLLDDGGELWTVPSRMPIEPDDWNRLHQEVMQATVAGEWLAAIADEGRKLILWDRDEAERNAAMKPDAPPGELSVNAAMELRPDGDESLPHLLLAGPEGTAVYDPHGRTWSMLPQGFTHLQPTPRGVYALTGEGELQRITIEEGKVVHESVLNDALEAVGLPGPREVVRFSIGTESLLVQTADGELLTVEQPDETIRFLVRKTDSQPAAGDAKSFGFMQRRLRELIFRECTRFVQEEVADLAAEGDNHFVLTGIGVLKVGPEWDISVLEGDAFTGQRQGRLVRIDERLYATDGERWLLVEEDRLSSIDEPPSAPASEGMLLDGSVWQVRKTDGPLEVAFTTGTEETTRTLRTRYVPGAGLAWDHPRQVRIDEDRLLLETADGRWRGISFTAKELAPLHHWRDVDPPRPSETPDGEEQILAELRGDADDDAPGPRWVKTEQGFLLRQTTPGGEVIETAWNEDGTLEFSTLLAVVPENNDYWIVAPEGFRKYSPEGLPLTEQRVRQPFSPEEALTLRGGRYLAVGENPSQLFRLEEGEWNRIDDPGQTPFANDVLLVERPTIRGRKRDGQLRFEVRAAENQPWIAIEWLEVQGCFDFQFATRAASFETEGNERLAVETPAGIVVWDRMGALPLVSLHPELEQLQVTAEGTVLARDRDPADQERRLLTPSPRGGWAAASGIDLSWRAISERWRVRETGDGPEILVSGVGEADRWTRLAVAEEGDFAYRRPDHLAQDPEGNLFTAGGRLVTRYELDEANRWLPRRIDELPAPVRELAALHDGRLVIEFDNRAAELTVEVWRPVDPGDVRSARSILWQDDEWTWRHPASGTRRTEREDSGHQTLEFRFDPEAGRFACDVIDQVGMSGNHLWLSSRTGLQAVSHQDGRVRFLDPRRLECRFRDNRRLDAVTVVTASPTREVLKILDADPQPGLLPLAGDEQAQALAESLFADSEWAITPAGIRWHGLPTGLAGRRFDHDRFTQWLSDGERAWLPTGVAVNVFTLDGAGDWQFQGVIPVPDRSEPSGNDASAEDADRFRYLIHEGSLTAVDPTGNARQWTGDPNGFPPGVEALSEHLWQPLEGTRLTRWPVLELNEWTWMRTAGGDLLARWQALLSGEDGETGSVANDWPAVRRAVPVRDLISDRGRFRFDEMEHVALDGETLWLAGLGGIVKRDLASGRLLDWWPAESLGDERSEFSVQGSALSETDRSTRDAQPAAGLPGEMIRLGWSDGPPDKGRLAVQGRDGRAWELDRTQQAEESVPGPPRPGARGDVWKRLPESPWETDAGEILSRTALVERIRPSGGTGTSLRYRESIGETGGLFRHGRLTADIITSVLPVDGAAETGDTPDAWGELYCATPAGLVRIRHPKGEDETPAASPSMRVEAQAGSIPDGLVEASGLFLHPDVKQPAAITANGRIAVRVSSGEAFGEPVAPDADLIRRADVRFGDEFWAWSRWGEEMQVDFPGLEREPDVPLIVNGRWSFDLLRKVRFHQGDLWTITAAGPVRFETETRRILEWSPRAFDAETQQPVPFGELDRFEEDPGTVVIRGAGFRYRLSADGWMREPVRGAESGRRIPVGPWAWDVVPWRRDGEQETGFLIRLLNERENIVNQYEVLKRTPFDELVDLETDGKRLWLILQHGVYVLTPQAVIPRT
jgi:ligand-binding sensor domain-containing protein